VHRRRRHQPELGPQLAARVDKMLAAGRVTEDEAARVHTAAEAGADVDAVVGEIRLRHARDWVDREVQRGRMTRADADDILERLGRGDDPGPLRGLRRRRGGA
jgi:hypothetical protein